jgi:hypothetical protein
MVQAQHLPPDEGVATVSGFLTVGFCRWEKPPVNHRTIDRGYHCLIRHLG